MHGTYIKRERDRNNEERWNGEERLEEVKIH
jgi:hypothetical protein